MYTFRVYALLDPRDYAIRYVGCTAKQLAHRLTDHLSSTGKAKRFQWLKELRMLNLRPEIHLLAEVKVARRLDAHAIEQEWVKKLRGEGHDLLNDWPKARRLSSLPKLSILKFDSSRSDVSGAVVSQVSHCQRFPRRS